MSYTDAEVDLMLQALFPGRALEWMGAEVGDGGVGDLLRSSAAALNADGFQLVERLEREVIVARVSEKLPDWERAFGLSGSNFATHGNDAQRQGQVIAHWREQGAANPTLIAAALAPAVGYVPALIECTRAGLDALNERDLASGYTANPGANTFTVTLADNAPASQAGARLMLNVSGGLTSDLEFTLIAPSGETHTWTGFDNAGFAAGSPFILASKDFARATIDGMWTLDVQNNGAVPIDLDSCYLLVEGIGRDSTTGAEGLGAAIFQWAVLVNPAAASSVYDAQLAREIVRRWMPGHTAGYLCQYNSLGGISCIFDDPLTPFDGGLFA